VAVCTARDSNRSRSSLPSQTPSCYLGFQADDRCADSMGVLSANRPALDSTRVRGPLPAAAAATATGQAVDDDAEERDDGIDNRHDAVANGAELDPGLARGGDKELGVARRTYHRLDAGDNGAHVCKVVGRVFCGGGIGRLDRGVDEMAWSRVCESVEVVELL